MLEDRPIYLAAREFQLALWRDLLLMVVAAGSQVHRALIQNELTGCWSQLLSSSVSPLGCRPESVGIVPSREVATPAECGCPI